MPRIGSSFQGFVNKWVNVNREHVVFAEDEHSVHSASTPGAATVPSLPPFEVRKPVSKLRKSSGTSKRRDPSSLKPPQSYDDDDLTHATRSSISTRRSAATQVTASSASVCSRRSAASYVTASSVASAHGSVASRRSAASVGSHRSAASHRSVGSYRSVGSQRSAASSHHSDASATYVTASSVAGSLSGLPHPHPSVNETMGYEGGQDEFHYKRLKRSLGNGKDPLPPQRPPLRPAAVPPQAPAVQGVYFDVDYCASPVPQQVQQSDPMDVSSPPATNLYHPLCASGPPVLGAPPVPISQHNFVDLSGADTCREPSPSMGVAATSSGPGGPILMIDHRVYSPPGSNEGNQGRKTARKKKASGEEVMASRLHAAGHQVRGGVTSPIPGVISAHQVPADAQMPAIKGVHVEGVQPNARDVDLTAKGSAPPMMHFVHHPPPITTSDEDYEETEHEDDEDYEDDDRMEVVVERNYRHKQELEPDDVKSTAEESKCSDTSSIEARMEAALVLSTQLPHSGDTKPSKGPPKKRGVKLKGKKIHEPEDTVRHGGSPRAGLWGRRENQ